MTKVKFCGLTRPKDIEAVNELKPDYVGFVFAPGRKRTVSKQTAKELKSLLSPEIIPVGVFVNETTDVVAELLNEGIIYMAQLHGDEDETYIAELRQKCRERKPVIRAIQFQSPGNISEAKEIPDSDADFLLLDSGTGTGKTFDWDLAKEITKPYFLAGGLCPENVRNAIDTLHPFAVDVSSGIETDGIKDFEKMKAFLTAVRG